MASEGPASPSENPTLSRGESIDSYASAKSEMLLSEDAFNNQHSRELFEAIDELRGCGANQDIELPELVIVGDQSVGKSSLLQGLTEIPFPVASRLCTRFPTRIVSRRTPGRAESVRISIEHRGVSVFEDKHQGKRWENYEAFGRIMPRMTSAEFQEVVDEATDLMGIKRSISGGTMSMESEQKGERNFSDDVLKIEISGPDRSHFSILDVPGVFQSLTKDLTDKEKDGVRAMVTSYIASKQSIIICVASGTNDLANQAVFDMVSKWDSNGERTVGVITKCDIAQDINQVMDLAENKEKNFRHGWFVVRNRTPSEADKGIGPLERDEMEQEFFRTQPWTNLPQERRGTQALKRYLADLLCIRIQKAFPSFLKDIQTLLASSRRELTSMATARKTSEAKRSYLTKIAQEFEKLASQSIRGRYDSLLTNDMKLRMKVREASDTFAHKMRSHGHTVPFLDEIAVATVKPRLSGTGESEWMKASPWQYSNPGNDQLHNPTNTGGGLSTRSEPFIVRPPRPGTFLMPVEALQEKEPSVYTSLHQSISSVEHYKNYSFEELRLKEYVQDKTTSSTPGKKVNEPIHPPQTSSTSLFGQPNSAQQASVGGFGGNGSYSNVVSAPTLGSGFGAGPSQPKPAATGLFGTASTSNSNPFGTPSQPSQPKPAATVLFGTASTSNSNPFGTPSQPSQPKQAATGLFGGASMSNSSPFSTPSQTNGFAATQDQANSAATGLPSRPKTSNIFSSSQAKLPASSGGLFSSKSTTQDPEICQWIRDEIKASRGTELQGTLNPDVLPILFHKQACNWGIMSDTHFMTIDSFTTKILTEVLRCVCTDKITRRRLEPMIHKASQESLDRGLQQLSRRMETILSKHLQTSNPAFEQKVSEARLARFQAALERYRSKQKTQLIRPSSNDSNRGHEGGEPDDQLLVIDMRDTAALFAELHMSNSQNLQDEVHDTLKAYYEIAREDFVEYVNHHVVEAYLDDPRGPVLFFDPLHVAGMSSEEIESLAAEDESLVRRRASKEEAIVRLSRAREIAERYTD